MFESKTSTATRWKKSTCFFKKFLILLASIVITRLWVSPAKQTYQFHAVADNHMFLSTQQNFENKLYHNECGGDFNLYVIHEVLITILSQNFS